MGEDASMWFKACAARAVQCLSSSVGCILFHKPGGSHIPGSRCMGGNVEPLNCAGVREKYGCTYPSPWHIDDGQDLRIAFVLPIGHQQMYTLRNEDTQQSFARTVFLNDIQHLVLPIGHQ